MNTQPPFLIRRRKLLVSLISLVLLLYGIWYYITLPVSAVYQKPSTTLAFGLPEQLKAHVKLLSTELAPRSADYPKKLQATADYIHTEFSKTKAPVTRQVYQVRGQSFQNIVAHFGPDSKQVIVVGAHYDSVSHTPGADDNASGVAGLIEIAKLLDQATLRTKIILVAYSTEEPPYFRTDDMGSFFHAKSLADKKTQVKLMISLEMIGFYADTAGSQSYPVSFLKYLYSDRGNFIGVIGKTGQAGHIRRFKKFLIQNTKLPVFSITSPTFVPGVDFSDHLNYWRFGFPAVMVTDTAFFRNANYHKASDTFDTLDYSRMSQLVQASFRAIVALANHRN